MLTGKNDPSTLDRRQLLSAVGLAFLAASARISAGSAQRQAITTAVFGLDTRRNNANQRSDAIMVSRVDLANPTVRTLSIPRDLYVEIPGYGNAKINDAYQVGLASDPELRWQSGAATAVSTIEHNFDLQIDHVAVVELRRLPDIVDAVGGVEVDNPYAIYVPEFPNFMGGGRRPLKFPAGSIHLDGASAMDFVRTRQQDGDGGRVRRQHLVLAAMLERLQEPEILPRIPELVTALSDIVHTDIAGQLRLDLMAMIPELTQDDLAFTNIDTMLWPDYTPAGAWIYQADWSTLPTYVGQWLAEEI